jgi:hypothetical protein
MALTLADKAWLAAELRAALEEALTAAAVDPAPQTDLGTAGGYDGAIPYVDDLDLGGRARPVRAAEVAPAARRARIGF